MPARLRILRRLVKFSEKVDFSYKTFVVEKKHIKDDTELIEKLARKLSDFITVFTTLFKNAEFKD